MKYVDNSLELVENIGLQRTTAAKLDESQTENFGTDLDVAYRNFEPMLKALNT